MVMFSPFLLQVTDQELQYMSESDRTDFLRRQIYPESDVSETRPEPEQVGSREEIVPESGRGNN